MREEMYPPRLDERDGKETKKNHQLRRPPSSHRELGKRESITHLDGIMRGYVSSTSLQRMEETSKQEKGRYMGMIRGRVE